jgi:hypothetical protein
MSQTASIRGLLHSYLQDIVALLGRTEDESPAELERTAEAFRFTAGQVEDLLGQLKESVEADMRQAALEDGER